MPSPPPTRPSSTPPLSSIATPRSPTPTRPPAPTFLLAFSSAPGPLLGPMLAETLKAAPPGTPLAGWFRSLRKLSAHENLSSSCQAHPFLTHTTSPTSPVSGCSADKFRSICEEPQASGWFHITVAAAHLKGVKVHEFRSQGVSAEGGGRGDTSEGVKVLESARMHGVSELQGCLRLRRGAGIEADLPGREAKWR